MEIANRFNLSRQLSVPNSLKIQQCFYIIEYRRKPLKYLLPIGGVPHLRQ